MCTYAYLLEMVVKVEQEARRSEIVILKVNDLNSLFNIKTRCSQWTFRPLRESSHSKCVYRFSLLLISYNFDMFCITLVDR